MIKQVYDNRNQSILVKVHPVYPIVEHLIVDGYIEEDFDVDTLYGAYDHDEIDAYWEMVKDVTNGIIDLLNDKIEEKEESIINAIKNGKPYDDEYWGESQTMSDMDKQMWILDEQPFLREFVSIRDVTGHPNPYRL